MEGESLIDFGGKEEKKDAWGSGWDDEAWDNLNN